MFPVVFLVFFSKQTWINHGCGVPYHIKKSRMQKCKVMCKCGANVMQMQIVGNLFVRMQCKFQIALPALVGAINFFFVDWVLAVPPSYFCKVFDFLEPIEPCWESNRTCQSDAVRRGEAPIPRVGKGVPGFGIERASPPVSELARRTTRPHRRPRGDIVNGPSAYLKSMEKLVMMRHLGHASP